MSDFAQESFSGIAVVKAFVKEAKELWAFKKLNVDNEKANIEIVKIILNELDKPESLITYVADRKGHDQRYAIDPSKANRELGWGPTTMFADGIKLTIQWYKDHMDWMQECTSGEYTKYYDQMYGNR